MTCSGSRWIGSEAGLLDGLDEPQRTARRALLDELHASGCGERETGLEPGYLLRNHTLLGLPRPDREAPVYGDDQLESLRVRAGLLEAGLSERDLDDMGR